MSRHVAACPRAIVSTARRWLSCPEPGREPKVIRQWDAAHSAWESIRVDTAGRQPRPPSPEKWAGALPVQGRGPERSPARALARRGFGSRDLGHERSVRLRRHFPSRGRRDASRRISHRRRRRPDWASWYPQWLLDLSELPRIPAPTPVRSELAWLLVSLNKEYTRTSAHVPWPQWYAERIIERFPSRQRTRPPTLNAHPASGRQGPRSCRAAESDQLELGADRDRAFETPGHRAEAGVE
jgi:hypothetical protein